MLPCILFLASYLIGSTDACAATSPTTTPTTTTTTVAPSSCTTCLQSLITITQIRGGAHAFQSDVTALVGACNVRTFTCVGPNANIELNGGAGVVTDAEDGATDGVATLAVTCNAAGTAWLYMNVPITQVECASN